MGQFKKGDVIYVSLNQSIGFTEGWPYKVIDTRNGSMTRLPQVYLLADDFVCKWVYESQCSLTPISAAKAVAPFQPGDIMRCIDATGVTYLTVGRDYICNTCVFISSNGNIWGVSFQNDNGDTTSVYASRFTLADSLAVDDSFDGRLTAEQERQHAIAPGKDKGWQPDRGINWDAHKGFMKAL